MSGLPSRFVAFQKTNPEIFEAYERLGEAARLAGPLDAKAHALAKLGIAIGARLEGAVHSHVRRALEAGCTREEIRHVALLGVTTLGFPSMMMALTWVEEVLASRT